MVTYALQGIEQARTKLDHHDEIRRGEQEHS
jgi:hypothetical protein